MKKGSYFHSFEKILTEEQLDIIEMQLAEHYDPLLKDDFADDWLKNKNSL